MDLAQRLQDLRRKAGYSQEQLAGLLGLSRQAVSKWEAGQGKPDIDNIIKLTEIYHVSADFILLGVPDKDESPPPPEKRELPREYRRAIQVSAIVAAAALATVLLITALSLLVKFVL